MALAGRKPRRISPAPLGVRAAAVILAGLACTGRSDDDPGLPPPTPGVQDDPFEDLGVTGVEFEASAPFTIVAGTPRALRVWVQPPGIHTVRFALVGQARDAYLSHDVVQTKPDGSAETLLTALSASSSYAVRAAAGRFAQVLSVVAQEANLGSLILVPRYPGNRIVARWTASVHVGTSCAELAGPPFPDGPSPRTSAGGSVQLDRVPAQSALAVVLRAERFAEGCRNLTGLRAGTDTLVDVDVIDRPLQIGDLNLRLSFSVESEPQLNPALDELAFRAVRPLNGSASDDLAALLDAMSGLAADPVAFEQARAERSWRSVLVSGLDPALPGTGLRTMVHEWMRSGLRRSSEVDALVGSLDAPNADGMATLQLTSVMDLSPAAAGFAAESAALVSAETDDLLQVGTTLDWQPSPLLAELASRVAIAENPVTRIDAADGMAENFGCGRVAELLVDAGASAGEAFAGCDEGCVLDLCRAAMGVLWSRVAGSSLPSVAWQITGASRAQIDGEARPTLVEGNWVGSLTVSEFGDTPIQGPFRGRAEAQ